MLGEGFAGIGEVTRFVEKLQHKKEEPWLV